MEMHSAPAFVDRTTLDNLKKPTCAQFTKSIQTPSGPNQVLLTVTGITGITALKLRTKTKYHSLYYEL